MLHSVCIGSSSLCHSVLRMLRNYKGSKPNRTVHYRITHQVLGTLVLCLWRWSIVLGKYAACSSTVYTLFWCCVVGTCCWPLFAKRFFFCTEIGILVLTWVPFPYQRVLVIGLLSPVPSDLLLSCFSASLRAAAPVLLFLPSVSLTWGVPAYLPSLTHQGLLSCPVPFHSRLPAPRHWYFFISPFLLSNTLPSLASVSSSQHILFCFLSASAIQASLNFCPLPCSSSAQPCISHHLISHPTWCYLSQADTERACDPSWEQGDQSVPA